MRIDTTFDFRSDAPEGRDPDRDSPRLRTYHRLLWSKSTPERSPVHVGPDNLRRLPSPSLRARGVRRLERHDDLHIHSLVPARADHPPVLRLRRTRASIESARRVFLIGGMIIWPSNTVDGKATINGARGLTLKVADRMDLTLECVRRHYDKGSSPPSEFSTDTRTTSPLFGSFRGFVEFFLLQDLVDEDFAVRFYALQQL